MFTGIVRERARTVSFADSRLVVKSSLAPRIGDSINVDGVCLTVDEAAARTEVRERSAALAR